MDEDATVYTNVDIRPDHIVLDRDPAPPRKEHSSPLGRLRGGCCAPFAGELGRPTSIVATVAR